MEWAIVAGLLLSLVACLGIVWKLRTPKRMPLAGSERHLTQLIPAKSIGGRRDVNHQAAAGLRDFKLVDIPLPSPDLLVQQVEASCDLSIVIPAFNESRRLPKMLQSTFKWLSEQSRFTSWEIIVVDDCSDDDTSRVALEFVRSLDIPLAGVKVLRLARNRGKGGAVIQGILASSGSYILFADADDATEIGCALKLSRAIDDDMLLRDGSAVAIGSRAHLVETAAVVQRSLVRNILMNVFHLVVYCLCADGVRSIGDTQCGFKMFSRRAAATIFPSMHVEGWIFDIEVLHLAFMHRIPVREIDVDWREIDGSKMSLIRDSIEMALDLLIIRINYALKLWSY